MGGNSKETDPLIHKQKKEDDGAMDADEAYEAELKVTATFRRNAILWLSFLTFLIAVIVVTLMLFIDSDDSPILYWTLIVIDTLLAIYLLLSIHGYNIWNRGPLPLQQEDNDDDAEYCTSSDGRRLIEFFVWGSERSDAAVVVYCHGSNNTGKHLNQFLFPQTVLEELNVKAISLSYPGHGGSDSHISRRISDWPITDLEPILYDEGVHEFIVIGTSYGTAHAMAVAAAFPKRCVGMGLNVPYLPEPICRELKLHTDADYIFREQQLLTQPSITLPILSLMSLFQKYLVKATKFYPEGKVALQTNPEILDILAEDCARSFWRGVNGQLYEMLNADTNQQWPDPRTSSIIETKNVAIWYAKDDTCCPPAHGKWLAEIFEEKSKKDGVNVNVRAEETGLGHFTYMVEEDRKTGVMTKVLLDMIGPEGISSSTTSNDEED